MTPTLDPETDYPSGHGALFASYARTAFRPFEPVTPEKQRLINHIVSCTQLLADFPGDYWQKRLGEAQAELDEYLDAESAITAAPGIVEHEAEHPLDLFPGAETAHDLADEATRSTACQCAHPDVVVNGTAIFCALCGGNIANPEAVAKLYDPMQDIADARREAGFGKGL